MNVSQFIGKKVVSTQGKTGYVLSVNGGNGRVECLACADEDEKEFLIDVKNIVSAGEKIVFDDRAGAMAAAKPLRLGRAGFDENGAYIQGDAVGEHTRTEATPVEREEPSAEVEGAPMDTLADTAPVE